MSEQKELQNLITFFKTQYNSTTEFWLSKDPNDFYFQDKEMDTPLQPPHM